jgi:hypothetical protein
MADTTKTADAPKADAPKMPIADIVEWLEYETRLGATLSADHTQRLIAALKAYGGTPTPRKPVAPVFVPPPDQIPPPQPPPSV